MYNSFGFNESLFDKITSIRRRNTNMQLIKNNESTASKRTIQFDMFQTDGVTPQAGLTFSVSEIQISTGGAQTNSAGSVTEIGNGSYAYIFTQAECTTNGMLSLRTNKPGYAIGVANAQIVPFDPYDAAALGLSRLDAAITTRSDPATAQKIDLTLTVTPRNLSAITTFTLADCLMAAASNGAGALTVVGNTLTIKAPDGTTMRSFTLDSSSAPTSRT